MTRGLKLFGAMILLALTAGPAPGAKPAPQTAGIPAGGTDEMRRPRVTSASFETQAAGRRLAAVARELGRRADGPVWAGYSVPAVTGERRMCCWDSISKSDACCSRCDLESSKGWGFSTDDRTGVSLEPTGRFLVLFRAGKDGVTQVRTLSEDCELDTGKRPFIWLTGVEESESLEWLATFAEKGDGKDKEEAGHASIAAIALHAGSRADTLLEGFASTGRPHDVREQALFWMGQTRGRTGYEYLRKVVREDPSTEIRKKAIFSMSQSSVPEAVDALIDLAHKDRSAEVRGEALFWLAQRAGNRAVQALSDAIEEDPELEVKKKAVFALSQLPKEDGVPLLIEVAKTHRLPEVRREAIFWLGQSGDPRALDLIEAILKS